MLLGLTSISKADSKMVRDELCVAKGKLRSPFRRSIKQAHKCTLRLSCRGKASNNSKRGNPPAQEAGGERTRLTLLEALGDSRKESTISRGTRLFMKRKSVAPKHASRADARGKREDLILKSPQMIEDSKERSRR